MFCEKFRRILFPFFFLWEKVIGLFWNIWKKSSSGQKNIWNMLSTINFDCFLKKYPPVSWNNSSGKLWMSPVWKDSQFVSAINYTSLQTIWSKQRIDYRQEKHLKKLSSTLELKELVKFSCLLISSNSIYGYLRLVRMLLWKK